MRGTPFLSSGWVGGLNTIDAVYELEETESRDCLNVQGTARGAIRKRLGSTQFIEAGKEPAVELTSLFKANVSGTEWQIAAGGGKIYSISAAGKVTEIGKGFNATARWSLVQAPVSHGVAAQGPIYMVNGVDAPQYWTGAGEVKAWKGVESNPKLTDGVLLFRKKLGTLLRSKTAGFLSVDVGLFVVGEHIPAGSQIRAVLSAEEVELSTGEAEETEEEKAGIHFEITRSYYKTAPHVPNGQFAIFAGNRIWITGIAADPSAIWFSELVSIGEGGAEGDPSNWPSTNVVRFDASDGYPITGLGTVGPYILLFKEHKTWVIHDLDTGANRKLADNIGCVAQRSIVETPLGTFFLTADQGIYLTNGSKLEEMSFKVRPTILEANAAARKNAAGTYYANHYYLSYPTASSSVNDRTLDYDTVLKAWWLHSLAANQWVSAEPTGETAPYALPPAVSAGIVRAFAPGFYTDSGEPYEGNYGLAAYWLSAWQVFSYYIFRHRVKTPFLKKRVRAIHFDGTGVIVPIVGKDFRTPGTEEPGVVENLPQTSPSLPVNFAQGAQTFGNEDESQVFGGTEYKGVTMFFGGSTEVGDARIYSPGIARAWSFGFGNADDQSFEVDSATWFIQFRKS
jgi:hypothetical protein